MNKMTDLKWIEEAKKKYGKIMSIVIGEQQYIYRYIFTKEAMDITMKYKDAVNEETGMLDPESQIKFENDIFKASVIFPETIDIDNMYSTVKPIIMNEINKGIEITEGPTEL